MEKINYYTNDSELSKVIHKSMEIFAVLKDMILKLDEQIISLEDKKNLSLFLGFRSTDSRVHKLLKEFYGELELAIEPGELEISEGIELFNHGFQDIVPELDSELSLEKFVVGLLKNPFILTIHEYYGYPMEKIKLRLKDASESKILIKTLQN